MVEPAHCLESICAYFEFQYGHVVELVVCFRLDGSGRLVLLAEMGVA